jgi:hypothetical protein
VRAHDVSSSLLVFIEAPPQADHKGNHQLLSGSRDDVLRRVAGEWKVAKRKILLDANVLLDKNLSVFL